MKSCADFQEAGDASAQDDLPTGWLSDSAQDFEQGALACTVGSDDAENLSGLDVKRDFAQRPEFLVRRACGSRFLEKPCERVTERVEVAGRAGSCPEPVPF